jgi:hypothetical protein
MYQSKLQSLLQSYDVFGADGIRAPKRFIKVFAVPATKLGSAVIDEIKRTTTFEHAFQLAKLAHITARVKWHLHIRSQAETDFIRLVVQVAGDDMVTALPQLADQACADSPQTARYQNI